MKILVTGGAGFIGSAVIRHLIANTSHSVINLDKLSYAGNLKSLANVSSDSRYTFAKLDICDAETLAAAVDFYQPSAIMHLAAESHVDRSIDSPDEFVNTNIFGTYTLLEVSRRYYANMSQAGRDEFRFLHVSSDEVYGDLGQSLDVADENHRYAPSSPYAASKASADHLVRAWGRTYGMPIIISNCSNNFGPYQFPEKFVPHMIINALKGNILPIYGDGLHVRDWLYVEDHARALVKIVNEGKIRETYNVSGLNHKRNIDLVTCLCELLEKLAPNKPPGVSRYQDLIKNVTDRPGHDVRYGLDSRKIERELDWKPELTLLSGLIATIKWYLENKSWWENLLSETYRLQRLGSVDGS